MRATAWRCARRAAKRPTRSFPSAICDREGQPGDPETMQDRKGANQPDFGALPGMTRGGAAGGAPAALPRAEPRISGIEIAAAVLSAVWLGLAALAFFLSPEAGAGQT